MNKNNLYQKGFALPVLLGILALLAVGGGAYIYKSKKVVVPVVVNETENTNTNKEDINNKADKIVMGNSDLKKFVRENYSFYAPSEWIESSVILEGGNSPGCELYSINYGGDGHRTGGAVGIYTKACFNSLKLSPSAIKENIEKNGYYIVAKYDKLTGTSPSEELKTKEVYKKVVETFTLNQKTMTVKVYFGDTIDAQNCLIPSYISRVIPKTTAVARAAIEELLRGPTVAEKSQDYWTGLNSGITIKSLSISNSVAYVDFYLPLVSTFNAPNTGTCGASILRNQIENTLKQFSTVKNVIITVNGKPMENFIDP